MAESNVKEVFGNRIVFGLIPGLYDRVTRTDIDTVTEDWTYFFKSTQVGIVRVVYDSVEKLAVLSVERTA